MQIDVRDLVKLHVQALTDPAAANQRFLVGTELFSYKRIANVLREEVPELKDRVVEEGAGTPPTPLLDDSKTKELLNFQPRPFEETVIDTVHRILELEKKLGGK